MLEIYINNLSDFLTISRTVIPDIITIVVVCGLLILSLKGSLSWITILSIYGIAMVLLTTLGINSIFNIITLIGLI